MVYEWAPCTLQEKLKNVSLSRTDTAWVIKLFVTQKYSKFPASRTYRIVFSCSPCVFRLLDFHLSWIRVFTCPDFHLTKCPTILISICHVFHMSWFPSVIIPSVMISICYDFHLSWFPSVMFSICYVSICHNFHLSWYPYVLFSICHDFHPSWFPTLICPAIHVSWFTYVMISICHDFNL